MIEATNLLAKKEAILLDPVYSGKGFAGLIGLIKNKKYKKNDNVLFIHTGGAVSLSAYEWAFNKYILMLSNKKIICPNNLINVAKKVGIVDAAIVNAGQIFPMESVHKAVQHDLINPVFIGDKNEINVSMLKN